MAMGTVTAGIAAGLLGTAAMDALNLMSARLGLVARIDVAMIGRMAAGWRAGRFRYASPEEIAAVPHERMQGYVAHYLIGVAFAVPFFLGWKLAMGGMLPPSYALAYGIATTVGPYLLIYPVMGLGVAGLRSPDGLRAPLSSLANHTFYGMGLAAAVLVL